MQPKMERMGRMMAAQDFGEKYGIDAYELLNDKDIKTPEDMEAKAKKLSQEKLDADKKAASNEIEQLRARIKVLEEGEPQYDRGQAGTTGPALPDTAKGKIKAGWEELSRKKK